MSVASFPNGQQPQMGMQQPQMGMQQPQMGMQQPQIGMQQPQMGMQQPQMGMQQPQMGMQQPQMGMQQQQGFSQQQQQGINQQQYQQNQNVIQNQQQHPNSVQNGIGGQPLVNGHPTRAPPKIQEDHHPVPKFSQPLEGGGSIPEGEPVHLESKVDAPTESSLQVDWYKDGKPLMIGSRFNTVYDRGYAVLDILYTFPEDAGVYSCHVTGKGGSAESNSVTLSIIPEVGDESEFQEPSNYTAPQSTPGLQRPSQIDRNYPTAPPQFTKSLPPTVMVNQGQPLRVDISVDNPTDPTLVMDWWKDGKPVSTGSRFNSICSRGYAILDIAYCYPEDSGQYCCYARNAIGEGQSSIVQVICNPDETVVTRSNLSEVSISNLRRIDNPGEEFNPRMSVVMEGVPPSFLTPIEPPQLNLHEGEPAMLCVRIDTANGNKIEVNWFVNGNIINNGSRITSSFELGMALLHIKPVYAEDTGSYQCMVATEHGIAQSSVTVIECSPENAVVKESQLQGDRLKGLQALQELEAALNSPLFRHQDTDVVSVPPSFVKMIDDVPQCEEGQSVHFDVRVEPMMDNNLVVEWYKNGESLTSGSRFYVQFERGVAILNIGNTIVADTGEYWCVARNRLGQTESNRVNFQCTGGAGIITSSNLMEGSKGLKWITEMDQDFPEQCGKDFRYRDIVEPESPPFFIVAPLSTTAGEGGPAKLLVKTMGNPCPTVKWFLNHEEVISNSVSKVYNDGSISYLEINRCQDLGEILVRVIASNTLGSADAEATLTVIPMDDFRPDLKHIKIENPYKKLARLKRVECSEELNEALKKKTSVETIRSVERDSEVKSRHAKTAEIAETEQMYDKIASQLRSHGMEPTLLRQLNYNDSQQHQQQMNNGFPNNTEVPNNNQMAMNMDQQHPSPAPPMQQ